MNPLQQQIKVLLHEQLSLDEKMISKIHLLPNINVDDIMEYLSVSYEKAKELLNAFIHRIEQGHVTHIRGNMDLYNKPIKSLGNLKSVGGNLNLRDTPITSIGHLQSVGGYLDLRRTTIKSLGKLQSVGGSLYLQHTKIKSLGHLKSVGENLDIMATPIKSLGRLQSVGGILYLHKDSILQAQVGKVQVGEEIYYF